MIDKIFESNFKTYLLLVLIILVGLGWHVFDVKFVTNDDFIISIRDYSFWSTAATEQGRIAHYINGIFALVPYIIDSFIYFKIIQFGTIIGIIVIISVFIKNIFKSNEIGFLIGLLLTLLWQNSMGHNLLVSYPLYIGLSIISFIASLHFFYKYLEEFKNIYLIISLLLWLFVSNGIEYWVPFIVLFIFISFTISKEISIKNKILKALYVTKYHFLVLLISLSIYFLYRYYNQSIYGGNSINIDVVSIMKSWIIYSLGLFPGYQFLLKIPEYGYEYLLLQIDFSMLLISAFVLYILVTFRNKINIKTPSNYIFSYLIVVSLYLIFIPTFLISLTKKYQDWALIHQVTDYLYSSISLIGIIFLILIVLIKISKNKFLYIGLSIIISFVILMTQINNKVIGEKQVKIGEKYKLLDSFFKSKYSDNIENLSAPSLWDHMHHREVAWTLYSQAKGKDIKVVKDSELKDSLLYVSGYNRFESYLVYSQNNQIQAVFTHSKNCNHIKPCVLVSTYNNKPVMDLFSTSVSYSGNNLFATSQLKYPKNVQDQVNIYELESQNIDIGNLISLSRIDISSFQNNVLDVLGNTYAIEQSNGNKWIWAYGKSEVNIYSPENTKQNVILDIEVPFPQTITITVNNREFKKIYTDKAAQSIEIKVNFINGINTLVINSDEMAKKLSSQDPRVFLYRITGIRLEKENK